MKSPPARPRRTDASTGRRARSHRATLRRVGIRVRALRDASGMPRRELADASGVSVRFLAELEAGSGNISVARLADVAQALGTTAAALLATHRSHRSHRSWAGGQDVA